MSDRSETLWPSRSESTTSGRVIVVLVLVPSVVFDAVTAPLSEHAVSVASETTAAAAIRRLR